MYNSAYENRELFLRLPSCSEMLIAIQDADDLIKYAGAPKDIIYLKIIQNMFKEKDDINTFESSLKGSSQLKKLVKEMIDSKEKKDPKENLMDMIAKTVLKAKTGELDKKIEEYANKVQEMIQFKEEQTKRFEDLEKIRKQEIDEELLKIKFGSDVLIAKKESKTALGNFQDSSQYIRRGKSVFDEENCEWTEVADFKFSDGMFSEALTRNIIEHAPDNNIIVYEDGFVLETFDKFKLIMIRDTDKDGAILIKFFINTVLLPSSSLIRLMDIVDLMAGIRLTGSDIKEFELNVNCLVYNKRTFDTLYSKIKPIEGQENVYSLYSQYKNKSSLRNSKEIFQKDILFDNKNLNSIRSFLANSDEISQKNKGQVLKKTIDEATG